MVSSCAKGNTLQHVGALLSYYALRAELNMAKKWRYETHSNIISKSSMARHPKIILQIAALLYNMYMGVLATLFEAEGAI